MLIGVPGQRLEAALLDLYEDTIFRCSASADSFQGIGHGFPKCQQCCHSPSLQSRVYGLRHTGYYLCCCVCGKKRHWETQYWWETDEMRNLSEVPEAWLGYLLPSPQCRELYIGSSIPALGNWVIYQGSAARRADAMQLFVHSSPAKRKRSRPELWLGCWAGGERGRSAGKTQFVRPLQSVDTAPCSRTGRCWNKA